MSMIGKTLAHYEITSQLGRGGMGEVYQAKDQKLGRDVAIKVLPDEFARDTDRVARFQREAKLLASLNHPNIAAIHGLEESEGTNFLVLELVEGQTLADRIKAGPIPAEESLRLALQIAEALQYQGHAGRQGQGAGFRIGQSVCGSSGDGPVEIPYPERCRHTTGRYSWHSGLYAARTGEGKSC